MLGPHLKTPSVIVDAAAGSSRDPGDMNEDFLDMIIRCQVPKPKPKPKPNKPKPKPNDCACSTRRDGRTLCEARKLEPSPSSVALITLASRVRAKETEM